jgi:hypothetical protein
MPVVLLAWRKYLPARRRRGSPSPAPTHGSPCPATPRTAGGLSASSFGRVRLRFGQLLNRRLLKRVSGLWLATWRQSAPARYVSPRLAVHRHTNKENSEPCRTIAITRNSEPPGSGATFSHYTCRGEDRPAAGTFPPRSSSRRMIERHDHPHGARATTSRKRPGRRRQFPSRARLSDNKNDRRTGISCAVG